MRQSGEGLSDAGQSDSREFGLGTRELLTWILPRMLTLLLTCQCLQLAGCAEMPPPTKVLGPVWEEHAVQDAALMFLLAYQKNKTPTPAGQAEPPLAIFDRTDSADALAIIEEMTDAPEYQALRGVFPILTDAALADYAQKNASPVRLDVKAYSVGERLKTVEYEGGVASLREGGWRGFKRRFPGVDSVRAISRAGFDQEKQLAVMTVITRLERERMVALFTLRWIEGRWQVLQIAPLAVVMYAKE